MIRKFYAKYVEDITEIPALVNTNHLPSLDGFRGISILMVVIGHLFVRRGYDAWQYIFNGNLGVYIFFVISGFLITTLLLKERLKTKTISLRKFYIRRFLRIFPVAYLYLFVLIFLNYFLHLHIPWLAFLSAALYIQNIEYFNLSWYTDHYWSLSIEEQFYLFFPSLIKKNLKLYSIVMPLLLLVIPLLVFVCRHVRFLEDSYFYYVVHFMLKFDGVMVGSFFSILVFKGLIPWAFIRKYKMPLNIILLALTMVIHNNHSLTAINHLSSFFIAVIIISNIYPADDVIFKFLNNKWLIKIGILSYSIYIWQQLFTMTRSEPTSANIPWYPLPVNVILLFVISYISYNYYEKSFLRLKDRFK